MQINGAQLATVFDPKPIALGEQTRKPVTIDGTASFKLADEAPAEEQLRLQTDQAALRVNDGQQARFIRFFSAAGEVSSPQQNESLSAQTAAKGVEQYSQIADLENRSEQKIIDEIV